MKVIIAVTLLCFVGLSWAGVIPMAEQYLELDADTNSEGGIREVREPIFGHHHHHHHHHGYGHYGYGHHGYGGLGYGGLGYGGLGYGGLGYGGFGVPIGLVG